LAASSLQSVGHGVRRHGPDRSAGDGREADGEIIAQRGDSLQWHVAAALDRPLAVLLRQDRPARRSMASSLGKMPTTSVGRLVSPDHFKRIDGVQFGAVRRLEGHISDDVGTRGKHAVESEDSKTAQERWAFYQPRQKPTDEREEMDSQAWLDQ
jgi:hypothetical protein